MCLESYFLAEFASVLRIVYPKNVRFDDPFEDNRDDDPLNPESVESSETK